MVSKIFHCLHPNENGKKTHKTSPQPSVYTLCMWSWARAKVGHEKRVQFRCHLLRTNIWSFLVKFLRKLDLILWYLWCTLHLSSFRNLWSTTQLQASTTDFTLVPVASFLANTLNQDVTMPKALSTTLQALFSWSCVACLWHHAWGMPVSGYGFWVLLQGKLRHH